MFKMILGKPQNIQNVPIILCTYIYFQTEFSELPLGSEEMLVVTIGYKS